MLAAPDVSVDNEAIRRWAQAERPDLEVKDRGRVVGRGGRRVQRRPRPTVSAWGDMGATWGDGPPERTIRVPMQVTAADLAAIREHSAAGSRRPSRRRPGHGTLPVTIRTEAPDGGGGRPARATFADLRQSLERWHRGDVSSLGVVEATRAYLDRLDAGPEEADTS